MAACSALRVKVAADCAWAEEIRFAEETKAWLEALEWPDSAYADFRKIGDHNELYRRFCKTQGAQ